MESLNILFERCSTGLLLSCLNAVPLGLCTLTWSWRVFRLGSCDTNDGAVVCKRGCCSDGGLF